MAISTVRLSNRTLPSCSMMAHSAVAVVVDDAVTETSRRTTKNSNAVPGFALFRQDVGYAQLTRIAHVNVIVMRSIGTVNLEFVHLYSAAGCCRILGDDCVTASQTWNGFGDIKRH